MNRINGLVRVLSSQDILQPTIVFGPSRGVRADILRSVVVFLHATFEVVVRTHIPKANRRWNFYSGIDLEIALKSSGIEARPFRFLYPPLTQMAKRRKRIVHEADFLHGDFHDWTITDDWELIMWLTAVVAFYYQLRISLHAEDIVERAMYKKVRAAMSSHVTFGKQLVSFPAVPQELQLQVLRESWPLLIVFSQRCTSTCATSLLRRAARGIVNRGSVGFRCEWSP